MLDTINVYLDDGAFMPERAYDTDAGMDLRSPIKTCVWNGDSVTIDTGVHVEIPKGYCGVLIGKSGLNVKYGLNGSGLIDSGYSGSIVCKLYNMNNNTRNHHIEIGDKIIQLVILPIETPKPVQVDKLWDSERGANGFGSTGN